MNKYEGPGGKRMHWKQPLRVPSKYDTHKNVGPEVPDLVIFTNKMQKLGLFFQFLNIGAIF